MLRGLTTAIVATPSDDFARVRLFIGITNMTESSGHQLGEKCATRLEEAEEKRSP